MGGSSPSRQYDRISPIIRNVDVCLVPFTDGQFTAIHSRTELGVSRQRLSFLVPCRRAARMQATGRGQTNGEERMCGALCSPSQFRLPYC
jgi:hypothetical protein